MADLDSDSMPDLVTGSIFTGIVSVLPGNGDGTFHPALSYDVFYSPQSVANGLSDIVSVLRHR